VTPVQAATYLAGDGARAKLQGRQRQNRRNHMYAALT